MKVKAWINSLLGFLVFFAISGCHDSDDSFPFIFVFENKIWELKAQGDKQNPQDALQNAYASILFKKATGKVSGFGGCNAYTGDYTTTGFTLSISNLTIDTAECALPEVMEQERILMALLRDAKSYTVAVNFFQIKTANGEVIQFKKPVAQNVSEEQNGTQVTLQEGDLLFVSLTSNPSTGFSWGITDVNGSVLFQVAEATYIAPEPTDPPTEGASGKELFRFKALNSGTTSLKMVYKQPWSPDVAQTFELAVDVNQ